LEVSGVIAFCFAPFFVASGQVSRISLIAVAIRRTETSVSNYAVWADKNLNCGAGIDYRSCIANALKRNGLVVFAFSEVDVVVTLDFRLDCRFEQERLARKWSHLRKLVGPEDLPPTTWSFLKRPILKFFQLPAQSNVGLINAVKCMITQGSVEPTMSDVNGTLYTCFVFGTGNPSCLKIELAN
jgi:hypothetical protein